MMNLKSKKILLAVLSIYFSSALADVTQPVPGQITESPYEKVEKDNSKKSNGTVFLFDSTSSVYENDSATTSSEESKFNSPLTGNDSWTNTYDAQDSKIQNNGEYLEYTNKEIAKGQFGRATSALTFSYLYDTFDYSDKNDIFKRTFENEDSAHSVKAGFLLLSYSKYLKRGFFDFYWKGGGGLSYNTGRGKFNDDGSLSNTTFNLWNIPIELGLGTKINMGKYFGLNLSASGLVVGTYQSRSDRKAGEENKEVRQILYGYSAEGAIEVSLSQMMPSFAQYLRFNSDVGDFSLAFTAKTIEASNSLADQYKISGASFGLGFKFELL